MRWVIITAPGNDKAVEPLEAQGLNDGRRYVTEDNEPLMVCFIIRYDLNKFRVG